MLHSDTVSSLPQDPSGQKDTSEHERSETDGDEHSRDAGNEASGLAGSALGRRPNETLPVTAARLRFLLNLKRHGGAAASERQR
jgi:hypothetical protein